MTSPDMWRRLGIRVWALLGVVALAGVALVVAARLSLVLITLVLALFPALLSPAGTRLKRRAPRSVAALGMIVALGGVVGVTVALVVPPFLAQLPALTDAATRGASTVEAVLQDSALPFDVDLDQAGDSLLDAAGPRRGRGPRTRRARRMAETLAALLLGLVALFFYLRDGHRIWYSLRALLPARAHDLADDLAERAWWTIGAYLRGQLLVALFDVVLIGLGLLVLGVQVVLPLSVLVFIGACSRSSGRSHLDSPPCSWPSPTRGSPPRCSSSLSVIVQQVEGNVLEPLVMSKVIGLHPLAIIVSVTTGGVLLGVLGAFLAVPVPGRPARWTSCGGAGPIGAPPTTSGVISDLEQRQGRQQRRARTRCGWTC